MVIFYGQQLDGCLMIVNFEANMDIYICSIGMRIDKILLIKGAIINSA